MSAKGFDASRYVVKLRGKEYLEVRWRLVWLRAEQPDAVIETELVSHDPERRVAVFRARVTLPNEGGSASGWKQECAAEFGDYLEKAETGALGRALAALGFGTQFAGLDEVDSETGEIAGARSGGDGDAPAQRTRRSAGGNGQTGEGGGRDRSAMPATAAQVQAIYKTGEHFCGWDAATVDARCQELFGVRPAELSRRQASELIDALKVEGGQAPHD